jgi:hypothetical protein
VILLPIEIVSFFDTEDRFKLLHDDVWSLEVSFLNEFFNKLNITGGLISSYSNIVKYIFLVKFDFIIQYRSLQG